MRKENIICLSGTVLPLATGLFIYLTSQGRTYLSDFAKMTGIAFPVIKYPPLIRNHGCDLLWGFALFCGLRLLADKEEPPYKSAVTAIAIAALLEILQCFRQIPGTFDLLDILTETAAVIAAMFITTLAGRLHKNEKIN